MWNRDVTRLGWGIAAGILIYDGVTHAVSGQAWGRIKEGGVLPVSEGRQAWPSACWRRRSASTSATASCSAGGGEPVTG
jgi:hypothetical protein